jgi:hypothetical protein
VPDSVLQLGFREDLTIGRAQRRRQLFCSWVPARKIEEQNKAQTDEFDKAAGEAAGQIAQQDDVKCQRYGKPGSAAYIDCRTSLNSDRAGMKK